jgi:RNA polymerase sigma-70 factor (ECF subfamily)
MSVPSAHALVGVAQSVLQRNELDGASLAASLAAFVARSRAAWPGVVLADDELVRGWAARLSPNADPLASLSAPHTSDLYLALACARGDDQALRTFQERFLHKVPLYLSKMRAEPGLAEEVQATLALRLLVGDGGAPPRIAEFNGRGPLDGWVRVAAIRTALNLTRRKRPEDTLVHEAGGARSDPELEIIRRLHRPDFEEAFRAALAELSARDRNVLRLRFGEGLGLHPLAVALGVHRATVTRWLAAAQESLITSMRRIVRERLRLTPSDCDSLLLLVRSRMEVTLRGLFPNED